MNVHWLMVYSFREMVILIVKVVTSNALLFVYFVDI